MTWQVMAHQAQSTETLVNLVCVDALNVAYWCGAPPALRLPLGLMVGLLRAGHPARLYFDANAKYQLGADAALYERLLHQHPASFIQVPSGKRADGHMLKAANAGDGLVISRDRYRDYRRRYRRLIDDPARLISGEVRDERLRIPALDLEVMLLPSAAAIAEMVEQQLTA